LFLAAIVPLGGSLVSRTRSPKIAPETRWSLIFPLSFLAIAFCVCQGSSTLNKSTFYVESAPVSDAGTSKIKGLMPCLATKIFGFIESALPHFRLHLPAYFSWPSRARSICGETCAGRRLKRAR